MKPMIRFIRHLSIPASETHLTVGLSVAAVVMALLLWAVIWQSSIIVYQRDLIRLLYPH
jgi:hypothetical protein